MLTNKIQELESSGSEADDADIFEQSLFTIFSDLRNQYGEPGHHVLYKSGTYGDIKLRLVDPEPSNNSLFSHFLWNASSIFDRQFRSAWGLLIWTRFFGELRDRRGYKLLRWSLIESLMSKIKR